MGLLYLARRLAPGMARGGKGAIVVTGNTSALRGRANFAGFAPTEHFPAKWKPVCRKKML